MLQLKTNVLYGRCIIDASCIIFFDINYAFDGSKKYIAISMNKINFPQILNNKYFNEVCPSFMYVVKYFLLNYVIIDDANMAIMHSAYYFIHHSVAIFFIGDTRTHISQSDHVIVACGRNLTQPDENRLQPGNDLILNRVYNNKFTLPLLNSCIGILSYAHVI